MGQKEEYPELNEIMQLINLVKLLEAKKDFDAALDKIKPKSRKKDLQDEAVYIIFLLLTPRLRKDSNCISWNKSL